MASSWNTRLSLELILKARPSYTKKWGYQFWKPSFCVSRFKFLRSGWILDVICVANNSSFNSHCRRENNWTSWPWFFFSCSFSKWNCLAKCHVKNQSHPILTKCLARMIHLMLFSSSTCSCHPITCLTSICFLTATEDQNKINKHIVDSKATKRYTYGTTKVHILSCWFPQTLKLW